MSDLNSVVLRELDNLRAEVNRLNGQLSYFLQPESNRVDVATQTDPLEESDDTQRELEAHELFFDVPRPRTSILRAHCSNRDTHEAPTSPKRRVYFADQQPELPVSESENALTFYLNPLSAIPHHDNNPKLKIAITHKNVTHRIRLDRNTTCLQLYEKVDRKFDIGFHEHRSDPFCIIYPRWTRVLPTEATLWSLGLRYFPNYLATIPDENLSSSHCLAVTYKGVGPDCDGDITKMHPDAKARRFGI